MAAQHMAKERKNAKARRKKKKDQKSAPEERSVKREGATVTSTENLGMVERTKRFLASVKAEFFRVSWPSKAELVAGTVVTMFTLILFSGYLGILDQVFARILK